MKELSRPIDACSEWILGNQIQDRQDANRGRGLRCYDQATGTKTLTGNWQTGTLCMSMLAMYKRTGDEKYLEAAEFAGHYIMSLQVVSRDDERYYGAIRELTPQSIEFAPRDATTAAWGLVWLYEATKNQKYLRRAELFGRWHMRFGMHDGWPLYACYMDHELEDFYSQGAFQSGTGLFYHDLFMVSGDSSFIEKGLRPIAEKYRDDFFYEDGQIISSRDPFTRKVSSSQEGRGMHAYNDDFGAAMLQAAADLFKDESYRETAYRYALWLSSEQRDDGGFSDNIHSGTPVALMYFNDLGTYYKDEKLLKARDKALEKLLSMQVFDTGDSQLDGAFSGKYEGSKELFDKNSICVNMRTTGYSLMALLKLSGELNDIWLGRFNPEFVDPQTKGMHNLIW